MDRKTYYVQVNSGTVIEDPTAFDYEFEIIASDEELERLEAMFENAEDDEIDVAQQSYIDGFFVSHREGESRDYDESLRQVYQMIYDLGAPQTREHIEKMGILS